MYEYKQDKTNVIDHAHKSPKLSWPQIDVPERVFHSLTSFHNHILNFTFTSQEEYRSWSQIGWSKGRVII